MTLLPFIPNFSREDDHNWKRHVPMMPLFYCSPPLSIALPPFLSPSCFLQYISLSLFYSFRTSSQFTLLFLSPPSLLSPRDSWWVDVQQDLVYGCQAGMGEPLWCPQSLWLFYGAGFWKVSVFMFIVAGKKNKKWKKPKTVKKQTKYHRMRVAVDLMRRNSNTNIQRHTIIQIWK